MQISDGKVFRYKDHEIRSIIIDGDRVFAMLDVCYALGMKHRNTADYYARIFDSVSLSRGQLSDWDVFRNVRGRLRFISVETVHQLLARVAPSHRYDVDGFLQWFNALCVEDPKDVQQPALAESAIEVCDCVDIVSESPLSPAEFVQSFVNQQFGIVRIVLIDHEPWFVGKDVALALGYSNTKDALSRHVEEEDKKRGSQIPTPSGAQTMTIINESGLYSLILSSKLPTAKEFKRWVTSEVLPSIRQTGAYIDNADMVVRTYFRDISKPQQDLVRVVFQHMEALNKNLTALKEENSDLAAENQALSEQASTWQPRSVLNALIRSYSMARHKGVFGYGWNDFYKELSYKEHIDLRLRRDESGQKRTIDTLKNEDEMNRAIKCAAAMCKRAGIDVGRVVNQVNEQAMG